MNRPLLYFLSSCTCTALVFLAGCKVGPDYRRPAEPTPQSFKEAGDWKPATPGDTAQRAPWWEAFGDPLLNELETQVQNSNQTVKQIAAVYEESRQIARANRASLFPFLGAGASATRSRQSSRGITESYSANLQASWEPDFWGRIRRQVESDVAGAQADAANLANALLSAQAQLAQDYLELRTLDERKRLIDEAVISYKRSLEIVQNKYAVGVTARADILTAEAQLDSAQAQSMDTGILRAQLEHAIAVLVGKFPSDFAIPAHENFQISPPVVPIELPAVLLERRPDVAQAERNMASASATIGLEIAAYFPNISLSATGGFQSSSLSHLFESPNRVWSVGGDLNQTLFSAGEHRANVLRARAAYDAELATYRQVVLTAFQNVEDNLAALRILEQELKVQSASVGHATEAARIALNEYKAGTADYTTVVTAQVIELNDRENELAVIQNRLVASVGLIRALGGGWNAADLPTRSQVLKR